MSHAYLPWGRYPIFPQRARVPRFPDEVSGLLESSTLAYGNGRSYGDVCQASSGQLLHTRGMDRLLAFDRERGTVQAQAGMTLHELIAITLPAGWFPAVTPGTGHLTLGGAIANDVHGKNHAAMGSFGDHILAMTLVRSDTGPLNCTPEQQPALFEATIGGLGLTGIIADLTMQLRRVPGSWLSAQTIRFDNLRDYFALADQHSEHEYSVAWIDCLAQGRQLGRGHYLLASHCPSDTAAPPVKSRTIAFTPPISLVNPLTLGPFNAAYYHRIGRAGRQGLVHYHPYFYPLDAIDGWNRLYGPRGFQQYQCVIPPEHEQQVIADLIRCIARKGQGSFLAVLKRFGQRRGRGLLSFCRPGTTLALDFPNTAAGLPSLFAHLDAMVGEAGGALYPAKDAHMSAALFQQGHPSWVQLEALRDPQLLSRFWQRVAFRDLDS